MSPQSESQTVSVCKEWNTFVEEPVAQAKKAPSGQIAAVGAGKTAVPVHISEISLDEQDRTSPTGFGENGQGPRKRDREGKSPCLSAVVRESGSRRCFYRSAETSPGGKTCPLYLPVEESLKQIKMRANAASDDHRRPFIPCETNLDTIHGAIERSKPDIVIIDSIQTMFREDISSAPGSVSQVRESTNLLMQIAKGYGVTIFIVGHVTKEGVVAGPRVLEHMVDTVLYFEGDRNDAYRVLRAVKNRFGSTNEIGVFEMEEKGLSEVLNPSEMLISGRPKEASGAVVACSLEERRPILLEVQALVTATNFGMARRTANGVDYNRINILLAILEKRCGFAMSRYDAYVNIAGGMKMNEPALDLADGDGTRVPSFKNREVDPGNTDRGEGRSLRQVERLPGSPEEVSRLSKMELYKLPAAEIESGEAEG
ncbi:MAG: DNA repair protein RadA [Pilosibacter sp.]